jgi:hypothetical protein
MKTKSKTARPRGEDDEKENDCDVDSLDGSSHSSSRPPLNQNLKSLQIREVSQERIPLPPPRKLFIPSTSFLLHEDSQYLSFHENMSNTRLSHPNERQKEYLSIIQSKREVKSTSLPPPSLL